MQNASPEVSLDLLFLVFDHTSALMKFNTATQEYCETVEGKTGDFMASDLKRNTIKALSYFNFDKHHSQALD